MKLLLLISLFLGFTSWSQNSVEEWQNNNPKVLLMSYDDYNSLSNEHQQKISNRVVLFYNEPTIEDIEAYESQFISNPTIEDNSTPSNPEIQQGNHIKIWLAQHPGLKVVSNSSYQMASNSLKQVYDQEEALILAGEVITLKDIEKYEASH